VPHVLLESLKQGSNCCCTDTENRDVVLKDSLYSAIGLAAASLEQHLNFNEFLQGTMVTEVQIQDQQYRLLRRRIALVLGQWVPVKYGDLNTDAIFQIFQHLLNRADPLNDLVVRITAGRQLSHVLDPYEFTAAHFMPFAQSIFGNLMSLVQEVELSETKMGLLETVRVAVVKMEHHVSSMRISFGSDINQDRRLLRSPIKFSRCFRPCGRNPGMSIS